jgi:hypothetical protein
VGIDQFQRTRTTDATEKGADAKKPVAYPAGFLQDSRAKVDEISKALKDGGVAVGPRGLPGNRPRDHFFWNNRGAKSWRA